MPSISRRGAASAVLAIAALAAPAAASAAPTVAVDGACYTPGMRIGLSGAGYTPGGPLQVSIGLGSITHGYTGTAGPAGEIGGGIAMPSYAGDPIDASLTAVDTAAVPPGLPPGPEQSAVATFRASPWFMIVPGWGNGRTTGTARAGRMTRVQAVGFVGTASTTLYAHYVRRGRHVKTTRIGALTGPCADLDTRFRQFPFKVRRGETYKVLFDTTRAWPNDDAGIVYRRVKVGRRSGATRRLLQQASPQPRAVGPARGA
jgi:hypothetical protein